MQEGLWPETVIEPEDYIADARFAFGAPVRTIALVSGGHDSTVLAHRCRDWYDELAYIDTGTALPGVREFVEELAAFVDHPLRVLEAGDAYRELVVGSPEWWLYWRRAREPRESLADFVVRTTPHRTRDDGHGNAPQGFPGPGPGGHRAAYVRLKERQIERLVREVKAERGAGRQRRVMLLTGARRHESRRRSMTQGVDGYRRRGSQVWVNPLNDWRNEQMHAYRLEHGLPESDVAALLHRSGECNCGAFMAAGELEDVKALFPDWHRSFIEPLEREAREWGIPRCVWGERTDSGRPGCRGYDFAGAAAAQTFLDLENEESRTELELCASCEARHAA